MFIVQGVYEYHRRTEVFRGKSFSIFYPGSFVPEWYTRRCNAPSLSFIVSHSKLRYLNTCIVYKLTSDRRQYFYMVINNRTKDKTIIYRPSCYGIPEGDENMTWLSHWKFGSHELECGDKVSISVFTHICDASFEVKEVGVHLVYQEEEHPSCDETSEYVIPMNENPRKHYGTTQIFFLGCIGEYTDLLVKAILGKNVQAGTVDSLEA